MNKYDIAISFAGEDRIIAEKIANLLGIKGISVFYDEYEKSKLWGKDLYSHLISVYRDESKYCLMILSKYYAKKLWTNHERKAAQERAFLENEEYILPLKIDNTKIEGIFGTTGYINYADTNIEEIVDLLLEKIFEYNRKNNIQYNITSLEKVFKKINVPNGPLKDRHFTIQCPVCEVFQKASEATMSVNNNETIYICINGCNPIIVISPPGIKSRPGRGYVIGKYSIRNASNLYIQTDGMSLPVEIPKSKFALAK